MTLVLKQLLIPPFYGLCFMQKKQESIKELLDAKFESEQIETADGTLSVPSGKRTA